MSCACARSAVYSQFALLPMCYDFALCSIFESGIRDHCLRVRRESGFGCILQAVFETGRASPRAFRPALRRPGRAGNLKAHKARAF